MGKKVILKKILNLPTSNRVKPGVRSVFLKVKIEWMTIFFFFKTGFANSFSFFLGGKRKGEKLAIDDNADVTRRSRG